MSTPETAAIVRLDDHRRRDDDGLSPVHPYRAGEVVWWRGRPWESLHAGNGARPEVVVEGHLYVSESWAPVSEDEDGSKATAP